MSSTQSIERRALNLSMYGTLFMAVLGFVFAALTGSRAILLDGIFSLINLLVVILSMKVVAKIASPATAKFHFGFFQFEPLLNLFRALLFFGVLIFATLSAGATILAGGRMMDVGIAVIYAIVATAGCFAAYAAVSYFHKKYPSNILNLEKKGWLLDGMMSGVVLITFVVGFMIRNTTYSWLLNYLDSAMVLIIGLIMFPIPIKILLSNALELLLSTPSDELKKEIEELVTECMANAGFERYELKMTKTGRQVYIYALIFSATAKVQVVDELRKVIQEHLMAREIPGDVSLEVTIDADLFEHVNDPIQSWVPAANAQT